MPTAIVPISTSESSNANNSNSPISSENGQLSTLPNIQTQVRTRHSRNNVNSSSPTKEGLSNNNRKSSLQRPQSIDIEDEFNDKIRSARLAALQNNSEDQNLTKINENIKNKMAPIFSPSRKVLLDSNGKQALIPKSQSPSPSKIPIANDYFDISSNRNHKRSNVSPPRKVTPPSGLVNENNSPYDMTAHKAESQISHQSRLNGNENLLLRNNHSNKNAEVDMNVTKDKKYDDIQFKEKESRLINASNFKEKANDFFSETTTNQRCQVNGSITEQHISSKTTVPSTIETNNSKIPMPKMLNNRSRSASQSPSKQSNVSSSPVISDPSMRGRSETKTRSTDYIVSPNSKESPTTPGLPTHGWCLQTERQEQRSAERSRNHLSEPPTYKGNHNCHQLCVRAY